jgi:hypothetical protein
MPRRCTSWVREKDFGIGPMEEQQRMEVITSKFFSEYRVGESKRRVGIR